MGKIVAIIGRPNVGKSTLFNRLVGYRKAIIDGTEGTTRDRHYGTTDWNGYEFSIIDTGGYTSSDEDVFQKEITRQVHIAIEEADAIIFLVDSSTGVTDLDSELADILRRQKVPTFLTVNKVDNQKRQMESYEFYSLGLGDPFTISAMTGSGTGDLLDAVVKSIRPTEEERIREEEQKKEEAKLPRFTIVGRPNVGKSSLSNALLGEERGIVTNVAGTTRDSIDSYYNKFGLEFRLVDTAGLRKKQKVEEDLEFYSVLRSIKAIEQSDVVILVIDATVGMDAQDLNIFQLIVKNKKGCVIAVNKWDAVENKQTNTARDYAEYIRKKLAPFNDVPIVFTSAIEKQRILDLVKTAATVYENRQRRISTSKLNEFILPIIGETPPPTIKGKYIQIKYCTMLPTEFPAFAFFVNLPQYIKDPYRRFLENKIRTNWNFSGCPIQIFFRQK